MDQPGAGGAVNDSVRGCIGPDRPDVLHAMRACTRCAALAEAGVSVPKLTSGQVGVVARKSYQRLARVRETILRLSVRGGLGPAPFGALREPLANDFVRRGVGPGPALTERGRRGRCLGGRRPLQICTGRSSRTTCSVPTPGSTRALMRRWQRWPSCIEEAVAVLILRCTSPRSGKATAGAPR